MHSTQERTKMKQFTRCPKCRAVNDAGAGYCYLCGCSPLIAACRNCGAELRNPLDNVCNSCGVDIFEHCPVRHCSRIEL
jgi:hypothetical protein